MKIETFEQKWQEKHPGGLARVGKGRKVEVTFKPDGKIYRYKGTILAIAEKLDLIPEVIVEDEAKKATIALKAGQEVTSFIECEDTIRYLWSNTGKTGRVDSKNDTTDKFDRQVVTFFITHKKSDWQVCNW